ncbi:MAG: porin [Planctomycetales bacterium]
MTLWSRQLRRTGALLSLIAFLWLTTAPHLIAQTPEPVQLQEVESGSEISAAIDQRIRQLEQSQKSLLEENHRLSLQLERLLSQQPLQPTDLVGDTLLPPPTSSSDQSTSDQTLPDPSTTLNSPSIDTADEFPLERLPDPINNGASPWEYYTCFDRGFVIRPLDPDKSPFELKITGQDQIRYAGFQRDVSTWTDSAGVVSPVDNMSNFQIPRGRLILSGFAFRKELLYNLNIDYNTVGNSQINFRAYWLAWRFGRGLTVYAGQSKVPGGREWLLSFVDTQGVDRTMATTFFRPSLSQGIWATGEPTDGVYYHVMMSNGFNTLGATPDQLSSLMAFSGSTWWEPWGSFGRGYSDFEWHEDPAIRIGTSLTYAPERGPQGGSSVPENSAIRLSDGTLITEIGALAPGVTLNAFKIGLATVDFAYKHHGFSMSGEFYSQNLYDLRGSGPIARSSIYQYGGFAQAGYFVIPQKLEPFLRTSHVTGPFGSGAEYAGGFNWFPLTGKQNLKFTFDTASLDNCPADQNRTNYVAGQTGLLVRSQLQIYF